jgi:hypothetical protein
LEALLRIVKILVRVVIIEMFLILTFAAVACPIFDNDDNFHNLSTSWLSLFECKLVVRTVLLNVLLLDPQMCLVVPAPPIHKVSTTVVNPSVWIPMDDESRTSAIFLIFFIITCVFYLHTLILSVVFQAFIQAARDVHQRPASE